MAARGDGARLLGTGETSRRRRREEQQRRRPASRRRSARGIVRHVVPAAGSCSGHGIPLRHRPPVAAARGVEKAASGGRAAEDAGVKVVAGVVEKDIVGKKGGGVYIMASSAGESTKGFGGGGK
jgi:hypothetical protein